MIIETLLYVQKINNFIEMCFTGEISLLILKDFKLFTYLNEQENKLKCCWLNINFQLDFLFFISIEKNQIKIGLFIHG